MRIVDYDLYAVPPRWLFLRVETDDGTVGWGEPVVEGRARTVKEAVAELVDDYLLGEDPLPVADHWERLHRGGFYRGGPVLMSAIAGIDQALWDIRGKHFGAPVHQLLGGPVRDRVRVYQWVGGDRPEGVVASQSDATGQSEITTSDDVAEAAREKVDAGFTALKMNGTPELERVESPAAVDRAAERLRTVREAVGPEIDIGVDLHGRATKTAAKQLVAALEPHDPFFVEEPVLPEHDDALADIAASTSTPIATGERMYHRTDFKRIFEENAVDIIQPDLSHAGGITEVQRIAAMAGAYDVSVAPHCPLGPVALASCLQLDAVAPNALIQEQSLDIHYNETSDVLDYLVDDSVFEYEDGFVPIPDGPGLGIEVDRDVLEERDGHDDWHNPVWRRPDGSVAEW